MDKYSEGELSKYSREDALGLIRELRNLAIVQDATLHLVLAVVGRENVHYIAQSQIECCRAAYQEVTGDESLIPERKGGAS